MTSSIQDKIIEFRQHVSDLQRQRYQAELTLAHELALIDTEDEEKFTKSVDVDASTVKVSFYKKGHTPELGGRIVKSVTYYQERD